MKKIILVVCLALFLLPGVVHAEKSFCLNGIDDALALRILEKTCLKNPNCDPNCNNLEKEKYLKIELIDYIKNKVWGLENESADAAALSTAEHNIAIPIDPNQ